MRFLDERLCDRTVTLYSFKEGLVTRTVVPKAYLQQRKTEKRTNVGHCREGEVLLILPDPRISIEPADRVYDGVGPEVTARQWPEFVPQLVPGLYQLKYVKPCYFMGILNHTEAGG